MSRLRAINDYFLVELETNPGGFISNLNVDEEGVRQGVVIDISDFYTFYGMSTFAFDSSLMDETLLKRIHEKYKNLVGKKVFWPARTEMGTSLEHEDKQYVFLKWSSVMAVEEGDK